MLSRNGYLSRTTTRIVLHGRHTPTLSPLRHLASTLKRFGHRGAAFLICGHWRSRFGGTNEARST